MRFSRAGEFLAKPCFQLVFFFFISALRERVSVSRNILNLLCVCISNDLETLIINSLLSVYRLVFDFRLANWQYRVPIYKERMNFQTRFSSEFTNYIIWRLSKSKRCIDLRDIHYSLFLMQQTSSDAASKTGQNYI